MSKHFEIAGGWHVGDCVADGWYHVIQGTNILHSTDDAEFADWLARRLNGEQGSPACDCGVKNSAVFECVYSDTRRCKACHMKHQESDEHKTEAAADETEAKS